MSRGVTSKPTGEMRQLTLWWAAASHPHEGIVMRLVRFHAVPPNTVARAVALGFSLQRLGISIIEIVAVDSEDFVDWMLCDV